MSVLVVLCCIWLIGNICIYSKRRIEEVTGIGLCILIIMLQFLAMLRHLSWIGIILIIISLTFLGMHIYKKNIKKVLLEMKRYMFTFGGAVLIIIVGICILTQYGRRVHSHDEFNFWATAIKTLWCYDGFASAVEMWSIWEYPQGMPLLEWFGSYLLGDYTEWTFYAMRLIFDFSMIIPLLKNIRIKFYWSPLVAVLVYLIPGMANATCYDLLSVDGDLALLFGFLIYSILERKRKDTFYYVRIVILSCTIVIIKDFSIIFVIYAWILLFMLDYLEKKAGTYQNRKFWNGIVILFPILMLIGWKSFLKMAGNTSTRVSGRASTFLDAFLTGTWNWTGHEGKLIRTFFKSFFIGRVNICLGADHNEGFLTPIIIVAGIISLLVILSRKGYLTKVMRNSLILYWLFIVVSYSMLLIITHCTLFVGEIVTYTKFKYMTASVGRYCAPVYLGGVLVVLLSVFDLAGQVESRKISYAKKRVFLGVAAMILLSTNYSAVIKSIWPLNEVVIMKQIKAAEKKFSGSFQWIDKLENEQGKIYYLGTKALQYSAYKMVPLIAQPPSAYYAIYSIAELQDYLYDNEFNYVYYEDNKSYEGFVNLFNQLLPANESMENGGLYKIDMSGVKFHLKKVN